MKILGHVKLLGIDCTVVDYGGVVLFCTSLTETKFEYMDSDLYIQSIKHYMKHKFGSETVIPDQVLEEIKALSELIERHKALHSFDFEIYIDERMMFITNERRKRQYGQFYNGADLNITLYAHKVKDRYEFTNATSKVARHHKLMEKLIK